MYTEKFYSPLGGGKFEGTLRSVTDVDPGDTRPKSTDSRKRPARSQVLPHHLFVQLQRAT
jgi:hypothetical protein